MGEGLLTAGFPRRDGVLACEGIPLDDLAEAVGTPAYVYSLGAVREQYHRLDSALAGVPRRIHYSMKANSSRAVLTLLRGLGAGADIVSGGELFRALRAGMSGGDIVFSGVGKTAGELRDALAADVLMVNVESEGELHLLDAIAGEMGRTAPVALRINPEVTVDTPHPYTRTGETGAKFGIPHVEALDVARTALTLPHIRLVGLDMHIGSQVTSVEPWRAGTERLVELLAAVRDAGAEDIRYLDVGGGLAVTYDEELPTDAEHFARAVVPAVRATGLTLIVEPGRFLVGNAGVLLTRVLYRKRTGGRSLVVTDAGMTDLLRPSHYDAYHRIDEVRARDAREVVDVVGPVCESGDFLALDREMPAVAVGDLLAVRSAGAYGFCMSSNYNSRPRAAEVVVDGDRWALATARERHEDLVQRECRTLEWRDR